MRVESKSSSGETAAATAGLDGIGILKGEAPLFEAVVKVELGPVEEKIALSVDGDLDSVMFGDEVVRRIEFVGKCKAVLKSAAPSAGDSDAQEGLRRVVPLLNDSLDFFGRFFGQSDGHGS